MQYKTIPYLDLHAFAEQNHLGELDGPFVDQLVEFWRIWSSRLHIVILNKEKDDTQGYVAIWLEDTVAEEITRSWNVSPSTGYILSALAGELCMAALRTVVPEVGTDGCAALPELTENESRFLQNAGVRLNEQSGTLDYQYGVLTYHPYKGRCNVCALQCNTFCRKRR